MAKQSHKKISPKEAIRLKHRKRIRDKVEGSTSRPRLAVFRSNSHIYAQLIDDSKGSTMASASTLDSDLKGKHASNVEGAKAVGNLIAKRALAKSVETVVFDRGGYLYHGKIKALADAAREGGLKF